MVYFTLVLMAPPNRERDWTQGSEPRHCGILCVAYIINSFQPPVQLFLGHAQPISSHKYFEVYTTLAIMGWL